MTTKKKRRKKPNIITRQNKKGQIRSIIIFHKLFAGNHNKSQLTNLFNFQHCYQKSRAAAAQHQQNYNKTEKSGQIN